MRVLRAAGCEVTVRSVRPAAANRPGTPATRPRRRSVARTTLAALEASGRRGRSRRRARRVVHHDGAGVLAGAVRRGRRPSRRRAGPPGGGADVRAVRVPGRPRPAGADRPGHPGRLSPLVPHAAASCASGAAPERLVDRVDGAERVAWEGDDRCCGFGGLFAVKLPEVSVAMADEKLVALAPTPGPMSSSVATPPAWPQLRTRSEPSAPPSAPATSPNSSTSPPMTDPRPHPAVLVQLPAAGRGRVQPERWARRESRHRGDAAGADGRGGGGHRAARAGDRRRRPVRRPSGARGWPAWRTPTGCAGAARAV